MNNVIRRGNVAALLLVASSALLPAIAEDASHPVLGGMAIMTLTGDPITTNPDVSSLVGDQISGCMVYEGLIFARADGSAEPALATSWTISSDNKVYSFKMRPARWHDGKPVVADDVRFSLQEVSAKLSPVFAGPGKYIKSIENKGDDEVIIELREPYGPFLNALSCSGGGAILPSHLFRGKGDVLSNPASTTKPVGSGPFKLVEWQRGNFLRFVKNPDYWDQGRPYLDEVIAKIVPNPSSRVQALRAGELDYVYSSFIANSDRPAIEKDRKLKLANTNSAPSQDMIFLNEQNAILANKDVRKALLVATDREYLVKNISGGRSTEGKGPFTSKFAWAFNEKADYSQTFRFDESDANRRLDEAGYPRKSNGERFELRLAYDSNDGDSTRLVQAIQGMWRKIGVTVILEGYDRPTISKRVFADRQFDCVYWTYGSFGDPAAGLTRIYSSSTIGTPFGNPSGYSNPKVDALFSQAARLSGLNERGALYKQAAALIAEDVPVLVLASNNNLDASVKQFEGLWGYIGYGQWSRAWMNKNDH